MNTVSRPLPASSGGPSIAIIAHEGSRRDLLALLCRFVHLLERCQLVATSGPALDCVRDVGLAAVSTADDVHSGDMHVASLAVGGSLDAVLFLRDPNLSPGSDVTLHALSRACDLANVPLATNSATAQAVLACMNADISSKEATAPNESNLVGERDRDRQPVLHSP